MSGKKTKKTDKSKEFFRPGTEEREIFCLVLSIISKLLDEKKVGIEVDSSGDLDFSLDQSEIKDFVTEKIKDQISFENSIKIISPEIASLLTASVYSDKTKGVQENIPSTIIKDVGIDEFIWRLEEVNKVLPIPEISKQELVFKKTVKGLLLNGIKWETNRKVFDDELGKLDNFEYATLSIFYSQPATELQGFRLASEGFSEGFSIRLPATNEPKQITLELQKKDVKKLIDNLQQILDTF